MTHKIPQLLLLAALAAAPTGCFHRAASTSMVSVKGPRTAVVDLWRAVPGADKLYVEADLGDGINRLFLLDTGASLSAVSEQVAQSLSLEVVDREGKLVGLSGEVPWRHTSVDKVRVGPYEVSGVDFAVGVPGVPTHAGLVPVAGVLGTNVWGRFQMAVDYPADVLELALPGHMTVPDTAEPMFFDGDHAQVRAVIEVERDGTRRSQPVMLEIDTGAGDMKLAGGSGIGLEDLSTAGVEAIFGIGPIDELPNSAFMRETRRLHVTRVEVGGRVVEEPRDITWFNYDPTRAAVGPVGMPGLLGHDVMDGYRAVFDFPGQRFALVESTRPAHSNDLQARELNRVRHAKDGDSVKERVGLLVAVGRQDEANEEIHAYVAHNSDDMEARVMLARVQRLVGDPEGALVTTLALPVPVLVEQGEIVATVNGLWLAGRHDEAINLAKEATTASADQDQAWVALSDVLHAAGDTTGARTALREANHLDENPDGHLLRRAWVSASEGDRYGALTHLRRLLDLYPTGGMAAWFYAVLVDDDEGRALLLDDLQRTRTRLHPGDGALDFMAAAYHRLGEHETANSLVEQGIARDCPKAESDESRDNCEAWYLVLARSNLAAARERIERALQADPVRTEFLDTYAMVLEAQGELERAREVSRTAASFRPDDVYLLWQAARLDEAASAGQGG